MERINDIRIDKINKKRGTSKKCCICCNCCYSKCCEVTRFILFAFICLSVIGVEYSYYEKYSPESSSSKNNTKILNDFIYNNNTNNNSEGKGLAEEIGTIIGYIISFPLILFASFISVGIYSCLLMYSFINRTYIMDDFFYGKNCSDNLSLIYSVDKLCGSMISLFYLGTLFYITAVKKETFNIREDSPYIFLNLLKIPHIQVVLYLIYAFILFCCIITKVFEKITIKLCSYRCCCKFCKKGFPIDICDECSFEPRDKESCCRKLLEGNRQKYIEKGLEEENMLLNNINNSGYYQMPNN